MHILLDGTFAQSTYGSEPGRPVIAVPTSGIRNPAWDTLRRLGPLLLLTYGAHLVEEYWGGIGFPAWVQLHTGIPLTKPIFLVLNTTFLLIMAAVVIAGSQREPARWLYVPVATVVGVNGTLLLGSSLLTMSYSPGLVTGVLLWIPLSLAILRAANNIWPRPRLRAGVVLGLFLHVLIPASAYLATRSR